MKKQEKGITLIALVVTIVVLLILAAVSISMLGGENGIVTQAQKSKEETRGANVEEERNLWKANQYLDEYSSVSSESLQELIDRLVNQGMLTEDEKDQILGNEEKGIEATGQVTIGSKTIIFQDDIVDLVGNISIEEDGVYIIVNFEKNVQEWAKIKAQEATNEEKEKMVMEIFTWMYKLVDPNYNSDLEKATTFEEWITILMESQESTEENIPKTVDEFINMIEIGDPENPTAIPVEEKLAIFIAEYTIGQNRGQITDPIGKTTNVCMDGEIKYKITQDAKYKFTGISYDGRNVELEIDVNLSDKYYLIPSIHNDIFVLQNAYKEDFFEIKSEYEPKLKRNDTGEIIDLTNCISYREFTNKNGEKFNNVCTIDLWKIKNEEMGIFEGEIWIEKNEEKLSWNGEFNVISY